MDKFSEITDWIKKTEEESRKTYRFGFSKLSVHSHMAPRQRKHEEKQNRTGLGEEGIMRGV